MTEHDIAAAESYFRLGHQVGCPREQMENLWRAGIILQERQLAACAAARLCDYPKGPTSVGFGGARGGGKSHWLLAQMGADDCQRVAGLKCLLLRKVGKANIEHFEDLRKRLFGALPHEFAAYRGILTFANGSRIIAGHFQAESDIDAYLGLEYDVIGIEEATTLSSRKHSDITTCCRSSKVLADGRHWRPRIYSTTNPGGLGHAWYKEMFLEPYLRRGEPYNFRKMAEQLGAGVIGDDVEVVPTGGKGLIGDDVEGVPTIFIPARVTDNRFNNPEYKAVLERLTGWQRRAWLDGDWDIQAGQFFRTFRRDAHVVSSFDEARAVEWFAALDYGFTHYTVVLLACRDGDGNTFIVDEHAERLWVPERHAEAIRAMLDRHNVPVESSLLRVESERAKPQTRRLQLRDLKSFVAGADVFGRQSDGESIAGQYRRQGIYLRPANMNRVNGWAEILSRLGDPAAGIPPKLFIHERCARLIETLPILQHDPLRPEDVLKVDADEEGRGGDDAVDALRYLIATKRQVPGAAVV